MTMELVPYTPEELHRDSIEERLALESNKKELMERNSNGIRVIAYWLMKENVCTIWVHDARTNTACEFPVANHEVMRWFEHPFAHRDANMPRYLQRSNDV